VPCDVRVEYDALSVAEVLSELLPPDVQAPTGYESVGHVAHLNLRPEQLPYRALIGQVLLDKLRPAVRTVVHKEGEISSTFRSLPLEVIAGERDLRVTVQHGAARLRFDYSKVCEPLCSHTMPLPVIEGHQCHRRHFEANM
jgi:tRNA (guanine37-N1)-methyltransferase